MSKHLADARQLFQAGRFGAALELASAIRRTSKDHAAARNLVAQCHYNIGVHQFSSGQHAQAEQSFATCRLLVPHHEDATNNLAGMLVMRGEVAQAIPLYEAVLKVNPRRHAAMFDLAVCLEREDRLDEASGLYRKLAVLRPDDGAAAMRDAVLVPSVLPDLAAVASYRQRTDRLLDVFLQSPLRIPHPERSNGSYFYFSYHGLGNRALNEKLARAYLHATPSLAWTAPHVPGWAAPTGRIRIGILSENLCDHSIGQTSRGIVAQLDRSRFEVVVVHIGTPRQDAVHDWINRHADRLVHARVQSLQSARESIAEVALDIAFWQDIGMSPFTYFLAFSRLAPVQVTSFGHPDTTGIPAIDHFISSELYEPEDAQAEYSEKLVQLPGAGTLSYYYRPEPPADLGRSAFGLPEEGPLYICPQTLFKIHPDMDDLLHRIQQRDPSARFVLIEPRQAHLKAGILKRLGARYPQLLPALVWIPRIADQPRYKALLRCADAMLDTVHFNGQNTNLEAFSLGLPVVTLPTGLHRGRHTYGMYRAMDFMDLVADSSDAYADLAVRLAHDGAFAGACRSRIAQSCGVLYENADFMARLQTALTAMVAKPADA